MKDKAPDRIKGWRNSQLSIARFYGGCIFRGCEYKICLVTDDLVRLDIYQDEEKHSRKMKRERAKAEKAKWETLQSNLFGGDHAKVESGGTEVQGMSGKFLSAATGEAEDF